MSWRRARKAKRKIGFVNRATEPKGTEAEGDDIGNIFVAGRSRANPMWKYLAA